MTGRFTGALGKAAETDPVTEAVVETPAVTPRRTPRRGRTEVTVRVEPKHLVQARVTRSQKLQFQATVVDLQKYFEEEVSQEEAIGALLILASEDNDVRERWMDVIDRLRGS